MTTIAYRDRIIAYDSRATSGGIIRDDNREKKIVKNGVPFFLVGSTSDFDRFLNVYFNYDQKIKEEDIACAGYVIENDKLFFIAMSDETHVMFKTPIPFDNYDAIGSGSYFALGAMEMGASAAESVEIASRRDTCTNNKIKTFTILR